MRKTVLLVKPYILVCIPVNMQKYCSEVFDISLFVLHLAIFFGLIRVIPSLTVKITWSTLSSPFTNWLKSWRLFDLESRVHQLMMLLETPSNNKVWSQCQLPGRFPCHYHNIGE